VTLMSPFSGEADRGFAIVAHIQQVKAFPSLPDPFDTRGGTPDPGAVALIVTSAHDCIAVRAHRQRLAIESAARGEDEFYDTVDPLRSRSLAGWLVLPADNNASIRADSIGSAGAVIEKFRKSGCRAAIDQVPCARTGLAELL